MGLGESAPSDHLNQGAPMQLTTLGVFRRYEELRPRLPKMPATVGTRRVGGLLEIASDFDLFIFDAFGVLVLGDTPIDGAPTVVAALKKMGKKVIILTNAATQDAAAQFGKYSRLGFPFAREEVVSSRSILEASIPDFPDVRNWGAILPPGGSLAGLPEGAATLSDNPDRFWQAEGYLFLSSKSWTTDCQRRLIDRLAERPATVLVGNPDLVAPREYGLSLEPGYFAHDILDQVDCDVRFFGKPFANAFTTAIERVEAACGAIAPSRVAMVGDTLHTDILGGAEAGLCTILVTDHGVLKGQDVDSLIEASGIRPDIIVPSI